MRIHHDDCDIPLPRFEDILNDLQAIPAQTRTKFIPAKSDMFAKMWINLIKISDSLGKILRIHYRVNGIKAEIGDINASYEELCSRRPQLAFTDTASELLLLHGHHVELFYE